jgi:hypothetical protein
VFSAASAVSAVSAVSARGAGLVMLVVPLMRLSLSLSGTANDIDGASMLFKRH